MIKGLGVATNDRPFILMEDVGKKETTVSINVRSQDMDLKDGNFGCQNKSFRGLMKVLIIK